MKAMWLTKSSLIWYAVTLGSLILVIGNLIALIRSVQARRSRRILLITGLNLLAGFLLFLVLMDCARFAYLTEPDPRYRAFQTTLFGLSWGLYAIPEALFAAILLLLLRDDRRYRRNHLTPDAIRETVNLLPEGICISAPDGTVLLSNLQMDRLCRSLTGGTLSDAARFREHLEESGEKQGDELLAHTEGDTVWRFAGKRMKENGMEYDQLTASDVTAPYWIMEELRGRNEHLQELQRRMKEVSDLSGEMFIAQEEAAARTALHNQLGQVLLMGRHTLEHPDSTDAEMVRMATLEMTRFLLRAAEAPSESRADRLQQALALTKSIGVQTEILGPLPENPAYRALLAQTIQECAANAVKHAEGDRLVLRTEKSEEGWMIRITNNGLPPKGPVTGSGGLLSLRRHTEAAGGAMAVESAPVFALVLRLPIHHDSDGEMSVHD